MYLPSDILCLSSAFKTEHPAGGGTSYSGPFWPFIGFMMLEGTRIHVIWFRRTEAVPSILKYYCQTTGILVTWSQSNG